MEFNIVNEQRRLVIININICIHVNTLKSFKTWYKMNCRALWRCFYIVIYNTVNVLQISHETGDSRENVYNARTGEICLDIDKKIMKIKII